MDPRAKPAIYAYIAFTKATQVSEQHPPAALQDPYPEGGDFTKFAFDPAKGNEVNAVLSFGQNGIALRGTPPTPRATVQSVGVDAKPYPTVTLQDCPMQPKNWTAYYVKTGKPLAAQPTSAPPPHLITATVIYYEHRWGVTKLAVDTKTTCKEGQ